MSLGGVIAILCLPNTHNHQLPDWEDHLPPEYRTDAAPAAPEPPATAPAGGSPAPAASGNDD